MSRNLGRTDCYYCDCELVLEEKSRPITEEEAGFYYGEYKNMLVAKAHCPDCWALYLAWMGQVPYGGTGLIATCSGINDLSFRHSFNDEPADEDLPQFHIVHHLELERVPFDEDGKYPPNILHRRWRTSSA